MDRDHGSEEVNKSFNDSLMDMLQTYCGQGRKEKQTSKRGKKIPVTPERAIDLLELSSTSAQPTTLPQNNADVDNVTKLGMQKEMIAGSCVTKEISLFIFSVLECHTKQEIITH